MPARWVVRTWLGGLCLVVGLTLVATVAQAQERREGQQTTTSRVSLELREYLLVEKQMKLAPGRYRFQLRNGALAIVNEETMVTQGTLFVDGLAQVSLGKAQARLVKKAGKARQIVIPVMDRRALILEARVQPAFTGKTVQAIDPDVKKSSGPRLGPNPAKKVDDLANIFFDRYKSLLLSCGEQAIRADWPANSKEFNRCVCPIFAKARGPKSKELKRQVAFYLIKYKNGVTLEIGKNGRVQQCRTWTGKRLKKELKQVKEQGSKSQQENP